MNWNLNIIEPKSIIVDQNIEGPVNCFKMGSLPKPVMYAVCPDYCCCSQIEYAKYVKQPPYCLFMVGVLNSQRQKCNGNCINPQKLYVCEEDLCVKFDPQNFKNKTDAPDKDCEQQPPKSAGG